MRYAVIMAGGAGKRLWPLSRMARPKQLLPLIGGKCLLELAVERLEGIFDPSNIWIITNAQYTDQIRQALPQLKDENVIGEPIGRDTANAVALATELIGARDEQATIAIFTADHVIRPQEYFAQAVNDACDAAEQNTDALITFGVRPTWPHTGMGYIQCRSAMEAGLREVDSFKEKPEHRVARQYVESGHHFWNSGMFVWTLGAIRENLANLLPDSLDKLRPIGQAAAEGQDITAMLAETYPTLQKISIDYAVMEKASRVLMVELSCEWLDIGSWPALEHVAELDEAGNAVVAENSILVDSFRNVVVCPDDHLLAILGMDDCIVVRSADATLVCNKSDSQRLKEFTKLIEERFSERYT